MVKRVRSMSNERAGQGLTRDTRPLEDRVLSREQCQFVDTVLGLIERLSDSGRHPPSRPVHEPGWRIELDPEPTYRSILIDGGRGTGKTSLMLTVLRQLQERPDRSVLILDPVDFDPMPDHESPYTAMVLAFGRLRDALEAHQPAPRLDAPWLADDRAVVEASLGERWRDLYRNALIGWGGFRGSVGRSDIDDFIDDQMSAGQGWNAMKAAWRGFIDALLARCEAARWLSRGGSLLLPIDDLDMTPHWALELTQALRQLEHPRLILVITGDSAHLERVIARRLWQREAGRSATDVDPEQLRQDVRSLARAHLDKVLPRSMRLEPPAFTVDEAFKMAAHRWGGDAARPWAEVDAAVVGAWRAAADAHSAMGGDRAELSIDGAPVMEEGFCIRDLAHALDGVSAERGSDEQARELLMALLGAFRVKEGDRLSDWLYPQDLDGKFAGWKAELHPATTVASSSEGVAERLAVVLSSPHDDRRALGRLGLLRLSHTLDDRRFSTRWEVRPWSRLVFHEHANAPMGGLGWPTRTDLPWTLRDAIHRLPPLRSETEEPSTEDLLAAWIELHRRWFTVDGKGTDGGRVEAELDLARALKAAVDSASRPSRWRRWVTEQLPVICGPAYALGIATKHTIFNALGRLAADTRQWLEWCVGWDARYEKLVSLPSNGDGTTVARDDADDDPWWFKGALFGETRWFERPANRRGSIRVLFDRKVRAQHDRLQPSMLLGLAVPAALGGAYETIPHWGTRALNTALDERGDGWRFLTELARSCDQNEQRPLQWFIDGWKQVAGLCERADVAHWFDTEPDEQNLRWMGPNDLRLIPVIGEPSRYGNLTVSPLDGWTTSPEPLPDALTGWLGMMQTLGFWRMRPDDRFEGWVTLPSGLATVPEGAWTFPPLATWFEVECFAAVWNRAINNVERQPRQVQADVNYLTRQWMLACQGSPGGRRLAVSASDQELIDRNPDQDDLRREAEGITGQRRDRRIMRLASWAHELEPWDPPILHLAQPLADPDRSELSPQRIGALARDADYHLGRADVIQRLRELERGPASLDGIDSLLKCLGDRATPWVERFIRDSCANNRP